MPSIFLKTTNETYYYSTLEAVIKNPIGKVSATLVEYTISTGIEDCTHFLCKLYKTKEGFWYDPSNPNDEVDTKTKHNIKAAIDAAENKNTAPKLFRI